MTARDYAAEITAAVAATDVAALARLAFRLLELVEEDGERRARQAEKKRRQRSSPDVPGRLFRPQMSRPVPGQPGTEDDAYSEKQDQLQTPHESPRARGPSHVPVVADPVFVAEMGALWPSVERFLARRKPATRAGWIAEMRKLIGGGSQYTPAHLAQVCDDDAALDRPLGSPFALRRFLLNARIEVDEGPNPSAPPSSSGPRRRPATGGGGGARNDAAIDAAVANLEVKYGK